MNEKQQIEEMREIVNTQKHICYEIDCTNCNYNDAFGSDCVDERNLMALYAAGYRKQSDVVSEFLQRLKEKESPKLLTWEYGEGYLDCLKMAEKVAAEFGAEVEK